MTEVFDIFISYRRDGGFATANHLYDLLTRDGYKVCFDINALHEGDFDISILNRIGGCTDFIVILDKHAFDRTLNPDFDSTKDWMRFEIAYALKLKKNIIPVLLPGFKGFPSELPEDIAGIITKNGPEYNRTYFDEFYKKLKSFLQSTPSEQQEPTHYSGVIFHSKENAVIYIDGEKLGIIHSGDSLNSSISKGKHTFSYSLISDPNKNYHETYNIETNGHYVVNIEKERFKSHHKKSKTTTAIVTAAVLLFLILCGGLLTWNHLSNGSIFKNDHSPAKVTDSICVNPVHGEYTYSGPIDENGFPHGKGLAKFPQGDIYDGGFIHGTFEGECTYYQNTTGDKFVGTYKNNERYEGTYIWKDGSYFSGTYKNNDINKGTMYDIDGNIVDKFE